MSWEPTGIPGVMRRSLALHPDDRGSFAELWRDSWTSRHGLDFVQANLSRSRPRVLRGMHFHLTQADLWVPVEGRALAAVADVRPVGADEPNGRRVETFELAPGNALLIPPGVAHGFYAHDDLALLYLVTSEYDGSDEHGFAWDDAAVAIPWPDTHPILSDRDRGNRPLAEVLLTLGQDEQTSRA